MLLFITIFIILGIIGIVLLLWASKDIEQQNIDSNSKPMNPVKQFRITVRSIAGAWFLILALIGLCMTITRLR